MFSWSKNIRILLFSNAWHVPVSESGAILVISFNDRLGRCCLLVVSFFFFFKLVVTFKWLRGDHGGWFLWSPV